MKTLLHAFLMCQCMFCAIPCPYHGWDEEAKDRMLLFLPLVGLELGLLWAGLAWLCQMLQLPVLVGALLLTAYPYLVTGSLHLDGFMDVTDAVKSYRSLERRREILKDSHVGSFAVINVVLLILTQFAFFASAKADSQPVILALIPVVSRCCSVLAVAALKPMNTSQYADRQYSRAHFILPTCLLGAALFAGFFLCGTAGLALIGCLIGYGAALRRAYRSLEGMNGDISGYALTIGELCAVAVYALIP